MYRVCESLTSQYPLWLQTQYIILCYAIIFESRAMEKYAYRDDKIAYCYIEIVAAYEQIPQRSAPTRQPQYIHRWQVLQVQEFLLRFQLRPRSS